MTDTEVLLRSAPVRKYCLQVFHRYIESGNINHERDKVGNLIKYLEETRSRLHKEAIEFIVGEGLTEAEAKKILTAECERMVAKDKPYPKHTANMILPRGHTFCGCCREVVSDFIKHRESLLHKEIEREALIIHTGAFPTAFFDVWQCQALADRAQKIMSEIPEGLS